MDKDAPILNALVVEAARVIVGDPKVAAQPWDKYALVAWYGEGVSTLNGFRYVGEELGQPATPGAADLEDRIDALRAAHRRSQMRRVGNEWVSTCRSRWSPPQHSNTIAHPLHRSSNITPHYHYTS